mgnify:CR=1 FL=1
MARLVEDRRRPRVADVPYHDVPGGPPARWRKVRVTGGPYPSVKLPPDAKRSPAVPAENVRGRNQDIRSARFLGDRAYLVTFERVDGDVDTRAELPLRAECGQAPAVAGR